METEIEQFGQEVEQATQEHGEVEKQIDALNKKLQTLEAKATETSENVKASKHALDKIKEQLRNQDLEIRKKTAEQTKAQQQLQETDLALIDLTHAQGRVTKDIRSATSMVSLVELEIEVTFSRAQVRSLSFAGYICNCSLTFFSSWQTSKTRTPGFSKSAIILERQGPRMTWLRTTEMPVKCRSKLLTYKSRKRGWRKR